MEKKFNPQRLRLARERRAMTLVSLGQAIGMSSKILSEYEHSRQEPPINTLDKISRVLDFPVDFFFGENLEELRADAVSFRAFSKLRVGQKNAALRAAEIALRLNRWLEKHFTLPIPNLPDLGNYDPEAAAMVLRNIWGLGEQPIKNVTHLLETKGVRIFSLTEDTRDLNAFSSWKDGAPFIFINTVKSAECRRFDVSHELAHLVLHKHGIAPKGGKYLESQANSFAAAFLMPAGSVRAYAPRFATVDKLIECKKIWIVSVSALIWRLKDLSLISEWQYHDLMVKISSRGMRAKEPDSATPETSSLLNMILRELWTDGITKMHIARELAVSPSEIEGLMCGLTIPASQSPEAKMRPALTRVK